MWENIDLPTKSIYSTKDTESLLPPKKTEEWKNKTAFNLDKHTEFAKKITEEVLRTSWYIYEKDEKSFQEIRKKMGINNFRNTNDNKELIWILTKNI